MRSDLPCASPRGRSAAHQEPGRRWSGSASESSASGVRLPSIHLRSEKQQKKRAVGAELPAASAAARRAPAPRLGARSSSWLRPPLGTLRVSAPPQQSRSPPGWRRPRLLLGAGPAGCPPRLPLQLASRLLLPVAGASRTVRSGGSRPRKFQSLGLRERRSARPPHVRLARLQASSDCRAAWCAPLLRGAGGSPARMRAARASLRLGTPGDSRSPSLSYTRGVAVARQRCE